MSPCEQAPASRNEKVAQGEISVSVVGRWPFNNDAARACLQQNHTIGRRLSSQRTGSARSMPGKDTLRPIMSLASHLLLIACPCRSAATGPRARGSAQLPNLPSHACILGCSAARPCRGTSTLEQAKTVHEHLRSQEHSWSVSAPHACMYATHSHEPDV